MELKETIDGIEKDIGEFSVHYKISNKSTDGKLVQEGNTYDIPFDQKPAEQLISALGGTKESHVLLSTATPAIKPSGNADIKIHGFTKTTAQKELTLTGKRLDRLLNSPEVHVNNDMMPAGWYQKKLDDQATALPAEANGVHWENLAVGVCLVQEVDLLVSTVKSKTGRAHTSVKEGTIVEDAPALLLLSSPRLNLTGDLGIHLDAKTQDQFIEGMFRNLFDVTQKKGRKYIAMPAAGLGKHGGKPEAYFAALMKVAKEFPELNIIYHPGDHEREFDRQLKKAKLGNVVRATKNVIFIADTLTQLGELCALHIPADSNVIYGLTDVGGHWKSIDEEPHHSTRVGDLFFGTKKNETSQTFMGALSTAPLNSIRFNPTKAYTNIVERKLSKAQDLGSVHNSTEALHSGSRSGTDSKPPASSNLNDLPGASTSKTTVNPLAEDTIKGNIPPQSPPVLVIPTADGTTKAPTPQTSANDASKSQPVPVITDGTIKASTPPTSVRDVPKTQQAPVIPSKDERPLTDASQSELSVTIPPVLQPPIPSPVIDGTASKPPISSPGSNGMFPPAKSLLTKLQLREVNQLITSLDDQINSWFPYPDKDLKKIKKAALELLYFARS